MKRELVPLFSLRPPACQETRYRGRERKGGCGVREVVGGCVCVWIDERWVGRQKAAAASDARLSA